MPLRRRAAAGDPSEAAFLGVVGLGPFSRLALPDHPPEELGLTAAYDAVSGHIIISLAVAGAAVSASPADLAYALNLPPAPIGFAEGEDAGVFSSPEAIAAVRRFVRDRVILGGGGDGEPAQGEVAAALRLVEEGKAYEVDWGGLVWAMVKGEVLAGAPRRYAPYLLHLMDCQIPELFAEFDGSLPPSKRSKGQEQHSQWDAVELLALDEEEEDASFVYGQNQNFGDFEDMPIFGKGDSVAFLGGEEIHAQSEGDGDLGLPNFSPFEVCLGKIEGYVPAMGIEFLNLEKSCRDTQEEVERIKKMVMEKEHLMAATKSDILQELTVRNTKMCSLEADMHLMRCDKEKQEELLAKSLAGFQDYRSRIMRGEGVHSYSEVLGISGGQNHASVQQAHHCLGQKISRIDRTMYLHSSKLLANITRMESSMVKLNHEVQRLNDSRSIPDLNNGIEDNGEGEMSLTKMEEKSCASEGCRVSGTAQAGKQPVQLLANPDKRNDGGESMDLNGVQS
ncbi:unnamed protein product [Urochloa humidicola]